MIRLWPRRRWLQAFVLGLLFVLVPYSFSRLKSESRRVSVHLDERSAAPRKFGGTLRVACFNIAHGRGLATSNWGGGDRTERRGRLSEISELLDEIDAEVVVLNEVDFDSSWSGHVNQAELLAMLSEYAYRVEQRNLDFRVLGWTWRFGNAVLSKYPIRAAELVELPSYSTWETTLFGQKQAVLCQVDVEGKVVRILGTHLSHRSEALRAKSADVIVAIAGSEATPLVVAGDLNSTPAGFPNSKLDQAGRNAIAVLDASGSFRRLPDSAPPEDEALTFPADGPNQVIDWVMIPRGWRFAEYQVVPTRLSDHRPVVAGIELSPE